MFENATICGPVVSASSFQPPVVVIAVGESGPSGLTVQIPDPGIFEEDPMTYFLEAFEREYDPASGLRFNAWVKVGM